MPIRHCRQRLIFWECLLGNAWSRWGLSNGSVCPDHRAYQELPQPHSTFALAEHLVSLAPVALSTIKAICNNLSMPSLHPDLQATFEATFAGSEFREGYNAFLEKRRPDFRKD